MLIGVGLVAVLLGSGCAGTSSSTAAHSNVPDAKLFRVGISPTQPPLVFKRGSQVAGLEADFARDLASHLGRTVRFVEIPWEKLIDELLAGKIDIVMSGMSVTQARQVRVNFTRPYLRAGQTALIRRSDAALMQVMLFSGEKSIGVQQGTTGEYFIQNNYPRSPLHQYKTPQQGADALLAKKIDAFINDAPVNWWLASENEAKGLTVLQVFLTDEFLAWAVRKEDTALLEAANAFVTACETDGRSQRYFQSWLPH